MRCIRKIIYCYFQCLPFTVATRCSRVSLRAVHWIEQDTTCGLSLSLMGMLVLATRGTSLTEDELLASAWCGFPYNLFGEALPAGTMVFLRQIDGVLLEREHQVGKNGCT